MKTRLGLLLIVLAAPLAAAAQNACDACRNSALQQSAVCHRNALNPTEGSECGLKLDAAREKCRQEACKGEPDDKRLGNFGWFAELAGSCWRGVRADGKAADEQCYQGQYNRFMRGTIKFYQGDRLTGEGDSVFAFDPNANVIVYTQWSSNGSFGFGEATLEAGELIFHNRMPDGSEAPARSSWKRVDADTYRVSRQRRSGRGWSEESAVTYSRVKR